MTASEKLAAEEAMTSAEILRARAERRDYVVAFTPAEVLALASLVEAAEQFGGDWDGMTRADHARKDRIDQALRALRDALEGGDE